MKLKDLKPGMVIASPAEREIFLMIELNNGDFEPDTKRWSWFAEGLKMRTRMFDCPRVGDTMLIDREFILRSHPIPPDRAEELKREAGLWPKEYTPDPNSNPLKQRF